MSSAATSATSSVIAPGVYLFDSKEEENQILEMQIQTSNGLSLRSDLAHLQFYQVCPGIDMYPEFYYTKVVEIRLKGGKDTISDKMGAFKKVAAEIAQILERTRPLKKEESQKDRYARERGEFIDCVVRHFQATLWAAKEKPAEQ